MPDLIGVLVIAWMTFGVASIFAIAIAFGQPPLPPPPRRRRPDDPTT